MVMVKQNQRGEVNGVLISLILCMLLLITAMIIAGWAIVGRSDYKNNSDKKVAVAVVRAKAEQSIIKDKQFAEESKNPLRVYNGPEAYGSVSVSFPKTWSAYVDDDGNGSAPVDGFFAPNVVPSINSRTTNFALRLQVSNRAYGEIVQTLANQQKQGKLKISAYSLPKLPRVVGVRVVGQLNEKNVDMVVLPLRSQTVQLWTEGDKFEADFNTYILPNFTFVP